MAKSNPDSIELREHTVMDGRKQLKVIELFIDGRRRAALEQRLNGDVYFRFDPIGAFQLQEARVWLLGLLELSIHAEELSNGKK